MCDLKKQLLLPSNTFVENPRNLIAALTPLPSGIKMAPLSHKRTMSDIPQFDEDAESVGSFSLENSIEHDVFEVIQFIVDAIVDDEVTLRGKNGSANRNVRDGFLHSTSASRPISSSSVDANIGNKPLASSFHNYIQDVPNLVTEITSGDSLMSKSVSAIAKVPSNIVAEGLPSYKAGRF